MRNGSERIAFGHAVGGSALSALSSGWILSNLTAEPNFVGSQEKETAPGKPGPLHQAPLLCAALSNA